MDTARLIVTLAIPALVVVLTYIIVTVDQGQVWRLGDDT